MCVLYLMSKSLPATQHRWTQVIVEKLIQNLDAKPSLQWQSSNTSYLQSATFSNSYRKKTCNSIIQFFTIIKRKAPTINLDAFGHQGDRTSSNNNILCCYYSISIFDLLWTLKKHNKSSIIKIQWVTYTG